MTNPRKYRQARRENVKRYVIDTYIACAIAYPDAANAVVSIRKVR